MPDDPYRGQSGKAGQRGIGKTGGAGGAGGAGGQGQPTGAGGGGGIGGAGGAGAKGETGEKGARGRRGKSSWGEWIRWGLTMIALVIALLNMQNIGQNATEGREQIVETGRIAIRSGCEFDNHRQQELKVGLELFLDDHRALHKMAERFDVPIDHHNLQRIQEGIDAISVRDCNKVAEILQVDE